VNLALVFLALAPIVALAYIVWAYRQKSAARAAGSSDRFARMLDPSAQSSATVHARAGSVLPDQDSNPVVAPRASYMRRAALLNAGRARLLEALREALPGHEIFARVSLASLIELTGVPEERERNPRLRALAQQTVDCVVCDKGFGVVAVVELETGQSADRQFKAECLKEAGVRYLRWDAAEFPGRDEIAAGVLGK